MKYGCNNKPAQSPDATYVAQSGWSETVRDGIGNPQRTPVYVDIKATFGTATCQYDKPTTDRMCAGCWQAQGAQSIVQHREAA